ncbi:MAG: T9SS type A sorting domain-containing protein [Vicingaceae bacterium]
MKKLPLILLFLVGGFSSALFAQKWVEEMQDPSVNFYQVQKSFEDYWQDKDISKGKGYKQFKRYEYFMEPRVYPSGNHINSSILWEEAREFEKIYGKGNRLAKTTTWRPLGPDDWQNYSYSPGLGRINNVRVDPNNPNIIYVGTPSGGCWKSIDAGQNWAPLADDLPVIGVSDIAINPRNSNELYIATGDGFGGDTYSIGILKSTDGGQNWNTTTFSAGRTQSIRMRRMLLHPTNPDTLWVATNVGLWRTDDGGTSWRSVLSGDVRSVKMHPSDTSIVYACTDQFYRSTDGGNSFSASNNGQGMNLPAQINRMEIAVSADSADVVYAVCGKASDASFYGLYRSSDAGQNWQLKSFTPNLFGHDMNGSNSGGQSWYDLAIAVNPNDADDVFVGGVNVWRSTNGGSNWSLKSHWVINNNAGYTHADIHALEFYNNELFCGSDGGIFKTTDLGSSWIDLSAGLEITQFYRMSHSELNDTLLLGGAQDNGSLLKTDSASWAHVYGADGMDNAIDPIDPRVMFFTSQNGNIQRSYDGGRTKGGVSGSIRSQESGAWVTPLELNPNNRFGIFAAFENVWYSGNRGSSWTSISNFNSGNTLRALAIAPSNSSVIYTVPNGNQIRRTTNFGTSWNWINSGLPNLAITDIYVHPSYEDSVWVSFSGYTVNRKVYVSGDGGSNWSNISSNMPNLPVNALEVDTSTGIIYVGTDVGVYYLDQANGPFWQSYMTGLPNVIVNDLETHYSSGALRAATYGRGIWEVNLIRPNITSVRTEQIETEAELLLYPNPNQGYFALKDEKESAQQIEVYDQQGRKVYESNLSKSQIHEFNLSELPRGLYLLRVYHQNNQLSSLKLLIEE